MASRPTEVTDPRAMRALAHPTRLALLEALAHAGRPLTATDAAELVGESPSSCSFHLRQLAKYGFVEEVEAGGGRRRPWRLTGLGLSFTVDASRGPESFMAAAALERVMRDRFLSRAAAALDARAAFPPEVQPHTGISQFLLYVTPEELAQVQEELLMLLMRHQDRMVDPAKRPDGAQPIEVLSIAYPLDEGG